MQLRFIFLVLFLATACGPNPQKNYDTRNASFFVNEGLGRAMGCSFTAVFYPLIVMKIDQAAMISFVSSIRIQPAQDLLEASRPNDGNVAFYQMLDRSYQHTRVNSDVRKQPLSFYRDLFSDGMVRLAHDGVQSDYIDFVRVVRLPNQREGESYGIRIYLDPHTFSMDTPVQVILFCPTH